MKEIVVNNADIAYQLWDLFKRKAKDGFNLWNDFPLGCLNEAQSSTLKKIIPITGHLS